MEYNLHKKRTLTSVLKDSGYKVHDQAELASLTAHFLKVFHEPNANSLHDDIRSGCCPFKLKPVKTNVKLWMPSMQEIEQEKLLECQRREQIEYQSMIAQQTEDEFKSRMFLARRPLPPDGPK